MNTTTTASSRLLEDTRTYRIGSPLNIPNGNNPHCIKYEYQQYPLSKHKAMDLTEKIDELEEAEYNE